MSKWNGKRYNGNRYPGIYMIRNELDGKVYIGQAENITGRWYQHIDRMHRGSAQHLYLAMKKHGITNFTFRILELCNDMTKEALTAREQHYIDQFNSIDPAVGYNNQNAIRKGAYNEGHKNI